MRSAAVPAAVLLVFAALLAGCGGLPWGASLGALVLGLVVGVAGCLDAARTGSAADVVDTTAGPDAVEDAAGVDAIDTVTAPVDSDGDGFPDDVDVCPFVADDQTDSDGDGYGDACFAPFSISPCCGPECSLDSDGDGVADVLDLCPYTANPDPPGDNVDHDRDGVGDLCDDDEDRDGDSVPDAVDNCPEAYNPAQANDDADCDAFGNVCDTQRGLDCLTPCGPYCSYDADGDGVVGGWPVIAPPACPAHAPSGDNCPHTPNADQADRDQDGVGDACDRCPDTPDPWQWDRDGDGRGDACDSITAAARDAARVRALDAFLGDGVLAPTTYLAAHPGAPARARADLRAALRARFAARGVLVDAA